MTSIHAGGGSQPPPGTSPSDPLQPSIPWFHESANLTHTTHAASEIEFPPLPSHLNRLHQSPSSLLNPTAAARPSKSFIDAVQSDHVTPALVTAKSMSFHRGEPAVFFSKEDIAKMAKPFKLSLIGKFSSGRPPMEVIRKFFVALGLKGNSQISLLDQRHVLINLTLEEDYNRLWLRQLWYINGRLMRMFKWSTSFRCSEESPIVPVWISLPFLPIHYVSCKQALYSIAAVIGKPLRVDHATATGNRPSMARVLIEYDISQKLLPRIWIGEGDEGFWQDIVFEKIPPYCFSCKHLGHDHNACYITKPELRQATKSFKSIQGVKKSDEDKSAEENVDAGEIEPNPAMHVIKADHRFSGQHENGVGSNGASATRVDGPQHTTIPVDVDVDSDTPREENLHGNLHGHANTYKNMENDVANLGTAHTDTLSREATADGLMESQKNGALILIDGVEGHGALVTSHGDLHLDCIPHVFSGPSHVQTKVASCETDGVQQDATTCMLSQETSMVAGEYGTDKGKVSASGTCMLADALHENNGHVAAVHGGLDSGVSHLHCPSLLPCQREGVQAAFGEKCSKVSSTTDPSTATTSDVGQEAIVPGPSNCLQPTQKESRAQPINAQHLSQPTSQSNSAQQTMAHGEIVHGLDNSQPIQEETLQPHLQEDNAQPNFQPISPSNSAQQTKAQEDIVHGLDSNLSHKPIFSAQVETTKAPVQALTLQPGQEPISALHKAKPTVATADETHSAQTNNALSKEVPGPIGTNGSSSSSAPNSFSFQAGQRIEFNPNPTVVVVDSLPMPRPIYNSEDYITDGTVDESDSFYMPDYSHVSFNTHSSTIPDDTYYGPISRSHSLDDREFCDEEIGIDARCGVSDSAIDKRIHTDADGFTKVTPRKARQYHLRPRNRRR